MNGGSGVSIGGVRILRTLNLHTSLSVSMEISNSNDYKS